MGAVTDLYQMASDFLAACEQAVATTPGGPISRSYVAPGIPALDCPPELIVYMAVPNLDANTLPFGPDLAVGRRPMPQGQGAVHLVDFVACVTRCAPTMSGTQGDPPNPSDIEAVAQETIADYWAVQNVVRALYRAKMLFVRGDGSDELYELYFLGGIPLDPSGGVAGWRIPVRVALDGYAPAVTP